MKRVAEKWVGHFEKKKRAKDLQEYLDVMKKKVFGPIVFGVDEKLEEPWIDAMSKFGLTQK